MPHNFKLPPGGRSLSGELALESYGGEMWDDLKKWLAGKDFVDIHMIKDKMKEIEKEYGITYV